MVAKFMTLRLVKSAMEPGRKKILAHQIKQTLPFTQLWIS
jgi:hypothetical protein